MEMQKNGFGAHMGLGLALALGVFGSSVYLGSTISKMKNADKTIEVKGYAEQKITSDIAVWSGDLVARDVNFAQAFAKLEQNKKRIYTFLNAEDIKEDGVALAPVTKEYVYQLNEKGERTNNIDGVVVRQNFSITSHDVQKISALSTKIDIVNAEGIEFESYRPHFYYSSDKLDKIKLELLGAATKSAQDRAQQIASNSRSGVGKLVNARQGIFQVTADNSTDLSDIGVYDTSTIDKVVKIVVTLSYVIE
jgi:uncharacterized protein